MEARVETVLGRNSAFILNLSCNGAMIHSADLPAVDASVVLRCGPLDVMGTVIWVQHERFGIQFDEAIPEEVVVNMRREADETARDAVHRDGRRRLGSGPISVAEWKTAQEWAISNSWR